MRCAEMEPWSPQGVGNGKEKWFILELIASGGTLGTNTDVPKRLKHTVIL
jgi:hypothetical protein